MSRPFKILLSLGGFFLSFWIIGGLIAISFNLMRSGIGAMMADRNFWIGTVTCLGIGLAIVGLFHVLSVALISPPSANRARLPRIYITVIWLLGGGLSLVWMLQVKQPEIITVWTYATFFLLVFALLVTVSNGDELGPRVRRDIPANKFKRLLAFLFFNGAAGGLVWLASLTAITCFVTNRTFAFAKIWKIWYSSGSGINVSVMEKMSLFNSITILYAFAYALTALFLHRKFFAKQPPKIAGLLVLLLAGLWAIVPSIGLFFLNRLSWQAVEGLQLGNVFNVFSLQDSSQQIYHLYFAVGWLGLMLALNAPWFLRQWRNFQPLPTSVPPPLGSENVPDLK
jgi:hypothetical protein